MIEEIKKDILNNSTIYKIKTDDYGNTKRYIHIETEKFYEILDKYNNMYPDYKDLLYQNDSLHSELQELKDYKNAWEELKNDLITLFNLICDDDTEFEFFKEIFCRKLEKMGIIKKS